MLLPPLTQKGPANSAIQNTVVSLKPSTCNEMHCAMIYIASIGFKIETAA